MTTPQVVIAEAAGVRIAACTGGAHLMTWTTQGVERLWMSPLSGCGGAEAIRGGVPVLFPQFATFGDLPKHGFARTALWQQVRARTEQDRAVLAFELTESLATREVWPHPFLARLAISASAHDLTMTLSVENRGNKLARFTGGLHTYLSVADPEAWIEGFAECHAWDGASTKSPNFPLRLPARIRALDTQDRVIHGCVAPVVLHDSVLGALEITARGFPSRVVWNPGPDHTLADVAPGDEAGFVCIEPTAVVPVVLPGGGTWEGSMRLALA